MILSVPGGSASPSRAHPDRSSDRHLFGSHCSAAAWPAGYWRSGRSGTASRFKACLHPARPGSIGRCHRPQARSLPPRCTHTVSARRHTRLPVSSSSLGCSLRQFRCHQAQRTPFSLARVTFAVFGPLPHTQPGPNHQPSHTIQRSQQFCRHRSLHSLAPPRECGTWLGHLPLECSIRVAPRSATALTLAAPRKFDPGVIQKHAEWEEAAECAPRLRGAWAWDR